VEANDVTRGIRIAVAIEVDEDRFTRQGGTRDLSNPFVVRNLIAHGLRAQLDAQSPGTGVPFVNLDFRPDTPLNLVLPPDSKPMEIPTLPTTME
jgi:hypothetical protein